MSHITVMQPESVLCSQKHFNVDAICTVGK
jgi:hypothetical protein